MDPVTIHKINEGPGSSSTPGGVKKLKNESNVDIRKKIAIIQKHLTSTFFFAFMLFCF